MCTKPSGVADPVELGECRSAGRPACRSTLARWAGASRYSGSVGGRVASATASRVSPLGQEDQPLEPGQHGGPRRCRVPGLDHGPDLRCSCASRCAEVAQRQAGLREEVQGEPPQLPVEGKHHGQASLQLGPCVAQVAAPVVEPAEIGHGRGQRHQAHPAAFVCSGQHLDGEVTHLAQVALRRSRGCMTRPGPSARERAGRCRALWRPTTAASRGAARDGSGVGPQPCPRTPGRMPGWQDPALAALRSNRSSSAAPDSTADPSPRS